MVRKWYENGSNVPYRDRGLPIRLAVVTRIGRVVSRIITIVCLAAGVAVASVAAYRSHTSLVEAQTFLDAQIAWNQHGRYLNPLDTEAIILNFSPYCGSCRVDLEAMSQIYRSDELPIIGVSTQPYPDTPLDFAATITGEQAYRFTCLYSLSLDTMVAVDSEGTVLAQKPHGVDAAEFYLDQLEARR